MTASSVELAQLGREAKKSLSGGRIRLVRAAQELTELRAADAQERRIGQRVREAVRHVRHEHVERRPHVHVVTSMSSRSSSVTSSGLAVHGRVVAC